MNAILEKAFVKGRLKLAAYTSVHGLHCKHMMRHAGMLKARTSLSGMIVLLENWAIIRLCLSYMTMGSRRFAAF